MANDKSQQGQGKANAPGQQKAEKRFQVTNADGTPYVNPTTGDDTMNQDEWKARDKAAGLVRPDADDAEGEDTSGGTTSSQS
jgi:hypothetical protein